MHALAKHRRRLDYESGLFAGFADCGVGRIFAGFDTARWELPGKAAFLDPTAHEEQAAIVDDDGGSDGGFGGCASHSAISSASRTAA